MRAGGNQRGARTISLALVAGLIAFETILALSAGAVGIPGSISSVSPRAAALKHQRQRPKVARASSPNLNHEQRRIKRRRRSRFPGSRGPAAARRPRRHPVDAWVRDKAKPDKPTAFADSAGREVLPWDAVEPVPYPTGEPRRVGGRHRLASGSGAGSAARARRADELPAGGEVETWVKAKATEIKGEERARPLYHFEYWLEPPEDMKGRLVAVAYEFNTPAVMPQSQVSSEKTGFRITRRRARCPDKVTITLKFNDGRSQQVAVDGEAAG